MRHETCLACRHVPDPLLYPLTVITETVSPRTHHHHAMACEDCGAWWFDDVVKGGLGILVPARRDTVLCSCPDAAAQYTRSVITVPGPESGCHCTAASVDARGRRIRVGGAR